MPDDLYFHAKGAESAKILSMFYAGAGVVANFVTTRVRRAVIQLNMFSPLILLNL